MSKKLYDAHLYEMPHIIVEQLDTIDKHFEEIEHSENICDDLPKMTKSLNK